MLCSPLVCLGEGGRVCPHTAAVTTVATLHSGGGAAGGAWYLKASLCVTRKGFFHAGRRVAHPSPPFPANRGKHRASRESGLIGQECQPPSHCPAHCNRSHTNKGAQGPAFLTDHGTTTLPPQQSSSPDTAPWWGPEELAGKGKGCDHSALGS